MHIKIVGFKIHLDVEFNFVDGQMTLLKGMSGAGKSSCLQAIYWCLYGNMRSIYNNARITKNLAVTLSLPGMTIYRQKNPDLLTVTLFENNTKRIYQDIVAQNLIDSRYGNRDLWKACSYIEQKTRCSLLSESGKKRMELLNFLSFTGENPKEYINKINEKLKEINFLFTKDQDTFVSELDLYKLSLTERSIKVLTEEQIVLLKNEISSLKEGRKNQEEKVLEQEKLLATCQYIASDIKSLGEKIILLGKKKFPPSLPYTPMPPPSPLIFTIPEHLYVSILPPSFSSLENPPFSPLELPSETLFLKETFLENYMLEKEKLIKEINFYENIIWTEKERRNREGENLKREIQRIRENVEKNKRELITEKEMLKKEEEILKKEKEEKEGIEREIERNISYQKYEDVKMEDIWKVSSLEEDRKRNMEICNSLGLEYNFDIISETLSRLSSQLSLYTNYERILPSYLKILDLEAQLRNLKDERNLEKENGEENGEESGEKKGEENISEKISRLEKLSMEKNLLLSDLKKGLELLSCPSCKIPLRYVNGSLSLGEREPVSKSEIENVFNDYNNIINQIKKLRLISNLEENRNILNKNIEVDRKELEEFRKAGSKISSLSTLINKISNVKYIPEIQFPSKILKEIFDYQSLFPKKEKIISNIKLREEYILKREESILKMEDSILKTEEEKTKLEEKYEEKIKEKIEENKSENEKNEKEKREKELIVLENKYKEEQERIKKEQDRIRIEQEKIRKEQERVRELQRKENERLRELLRYEEEKKRREFEKENEILNYKKSEEERRIKYSLEIEKLEEEKKNLANEILSLEKRKEELEKKKIEYEKQIDANCKSRLEEIEKILKEKKTLLDDALYGNKCVEKGKELERKREALVELHKDVTILNRLKLKAIEIECKQLEDTVNNINTVLETTLPIFFLEPISLKLLLYKKTKKEGTTKPGLNLEISYKGFKYDNINLLSGGEGDRISLALLLALNAVSNSPIILLDECVSSLDGDLKESCITAIKSIPNKTVICVDHDDSLEGFYDSIITI